MAQAALVHAQFEGIHPFADGLDEGDLDIGDPRSLGRRAAMLAVAGTVWRRHLGPLLTTKQVAELLGVGTRQAVSDRVKRRRVLALPPSRDASGSTWCPRRDATARDAAPAPEGATGG